MTGQEDIEATCVVLAERVADIGEGVPEMAILPIYSDFWPTVSALIFICTGKMLPSRSDPMVR